MSCPDWRTLGARRDREPEIWDAALRHLDGCSHCVDAALAAEPTLLFHRLPAPRLRRGEIAEMQQAVAALRRNSRRRTPPAWLRAAAVAAVLITAALLDGAVRRDAETREPGALAARGAAADVARFIEPGLLREGMPEPGLAAAPEPWEAGPQTLALERMPLVEYSDPSYGSVVEVVDDEVSLVLVLPLEGRTPGGRTPVDDV
jgi:hypothetical protein